MGASSEGVPTDGGSAPDSWVINEEFAQRLGCGVIAALVLPLWFALLLFAVQSTAALTVTLLLFVTTVVFAAAALRRSRKLARSVRLDGDVLVAEAKSSTARFPLAGLRRVDIGTSLGVWPLRLTFADGSVLRLPRELDDLAGFLDALATRCPGLVVEDHNPRPDAATEADHDPRSRPR